MRTFTRYLVIRANGEMRIRNGRPRSKELALDECAVPIVVTIPDGWGAVVDDQIDIAFPPPPDIDPGGDPIIIGEGPDIDDAEVSA